MTEHTTYTIYYIFYYMTYAITDYDVLTAENTHNYVLSNPFGRQTFRHQTISIMKNSLGVFEQTNLVYSRKKATKIHLLNLEIAITSNLVLYFSRYL